MNEKYLLFIGLLIFSYSSFSQAYKNPGIPVEKRIKSLLAQMTLGEKIDYLGGWHNYFICIVPRLGLPAIKMSDGPVGSRNDGQSTAYPAGILSAATWDLKLKGNVKIK